MLTYSPTDIVCSCLSCRKWLATMSDPPTNRIQHLISQLIIKTSMEYNDIIDCRVYSVLLSRPRRLHSLIVKNKLHGQHKRNCNLQSMITIALTCTRVWTLTYLFFIYLFIYLFFIYLFFIYFLNLFVIFIYLII